MKSNLTTWLPLAIVIVLLVPSLGLSQQTVAIGDSNPKSNAILYLKGNGTQGLIIPIVTAPGSFGEAGMVVYNSTDKKLHYHDGNSWVVVGGNSVVIDGVVGNEVTGVGATGGLILSGSGTTASPLTISMMQGTTNGQVLKWNDTTKKWELGTDNTGSVALNSTQILVGNASNVASAVAMSGDATLSNNGTLSIANNAVTTTKILDGTIINADIAAAAAIAPSKLGQAGATNQQVLKWNGTAWAPAADNAGAAASLNDGQIFIGNAANTVIPVIPSGDATISNAGVITISNNAINSAKISDGTVSSADIANNTIVNADINAAAAIDGTKVNPSFGAQDIVTTGSTSTGNLAASGTATFNALTGAGTRMVTASPTGVIGTQPIPSAAFSTLNTLPKGDGTGMVNSQIFDNGTNIGIGTTTPSYLLDLNKTLTSGTDANLRVFNPSNNPGDKSGIRFGVGDFWAVHLNTVLNGDWLELTDNSGNAWHRWTADSYYPGGGASYIQGTGLNLAIMAGFTGFGITTPDRKVEVRDGANYQVMRLTSGSSGAGVELVSETSDDWLLTSWANNFFLSQSSNDFASQTDQFIFSTTAFTPASDNTKSLGGAVRRWTAVYSINGSIQTSDIRMKNNISGLKYGLKEVLKLRPVLYSWKSDPASRKVGLIAQEVRNLIPEVVTDGETLGMNYGELVPVLINAIQEQQKIIENLEEKIKSLQSAKSDEFETLKAEVDAIKKAMGIDANSGK